MTQRKGITAADPRLKAMNDALERDRLRLTDAEWKLYGKRIFFDTYRERIERIDGRESRMNGRTEAERMAAEHEAANPPMRLTDAEREAVDRARIAFRDMDHNAMTMQQIEDYESLCGLLDRLA